VVEITGVASLLDRPGQATPALSVLVRDLKVLHQAGAMARDKVLLVVLAVSLIALGSSAWLVLLRRTVRIQTGVIRARLEREARLESDYRRLFERNPAGVFRWRPDGKIVDANPAFAHMLDAGTPQALIGRSYWDFEPGGRAELETLKAGSVVRREVQLHKATGGGLWLIEHVCAVDTPEGVMLEATAIDVTEKRRYREELMDAKDQLEDRVRRRTADLEAEIARREQAEQELMAAKAHAEQISSAKSSFLANMSHELRTPLNAVIGYSEMLTELAAENGNTAYLADLGRIQAAGKHLLALINDILDLSKIEAGRMEVRPERIRVEDIVQDVLATVEPMARKSGNTLRADLSGAPAEVVADPMRFRQSLLNLLSNACKFTENGDVALTVNRAAGGWVEWSVADTGVGMSQEQQQQLFQPFSQVDGAARTRFSGTGLGLAISRRFCQLMGGDIRVSSTPGEGSRFVIRIPDEVTPPES
jgi:PAS domain S-box-containing protein